MRVEILISDDLGEEQLKIDKHIEPTNEDILKVKQLLEKCIKALGN